MASSFPTSLDNFTNPTASSLLTSPSHSLSHSDLNDAVEALQAKVAIGNTVLGSYISYTPTFPAGLTIGNGTVTGFYCRVNGFVHVWGRAVLGSTSSVTGAINLTVPVSIDATVSGTFLGTYIGQVGIRDDSAATSYSGVVQTLGIAGFPTRVALQVQNASATYSTGAAISATVPMTWAVDDTIWWNMYYEAA
jgi:hypothetical protein